MDSASVRAQISVNETPVSSVKTGTIVTSVAFGPLKITSGTGIGQAQQTFADDATIAASGSKVYDLHAFGGAMDELGNAYALTRIVALLIINLATDPTAILTVEPDATNGFASINGSTSNVIAEIPPGGAFLIVAPSAAALLASATVKGLKLANGSSTVGAEIQIQVIGS